MGALISRSQNSDNINTIYGLPKHPAKNIVINEKSGPIKISNINSFCMIREMLEKKSENLTDADIKELSEKCRREIEFKIDEKPVSKVVEGFHQSLNSSSDILFLILALIIIYSCLYMHT